MYVSKKNGLNIILLPLIMISLICSAFTFNGMNLLQVSPLVSAQISQSSHIQIQSTSTYTDAFGNFHIIGEVNNTSTQSQTDIVITALLSDTTSNNTVIGNHSAFTSIGTLRTGEFSPFDIVIQDSQQNSGKFNFMEFSTTSAPTIAEKPANLVINGSSSFVDNAGNPHITGNIINQGQSPEQFLNLVATIYDNSSLGVIGTQTFELDAETLANNQMAPFDITITDNKSKSQGAFYSLNIDSSQSSMSFPLNSKISFATTGAFTGSGGGDMLDNNFPLNNQPGFVISNNDESNTRDNADDENDSGDNQRGEKKTDDDGNPWFNDDNCSEESGSSGGSSSECDEAEREEESEREDEDSSETDQGPPSNSDPDSTNDNNDESEDNLDDSNGDEGTENNENNGEEGKDNNN
jgi:hypothetical protein